MDVVEELEKNHARLREQVTVLPGSIRKEINKRVSQTLQEIRKEIEEMETKPFTVYASSNTDYFDGAKAVIDQVLQVIDRRLTDSNDTL